MKIIGAGFGRTGTLSIKKALEQIGYGPCYHMMEVPKNWHHIKQWQAAANGEPVDYKKLFKKYQSSVDFPASIFYKDIYKTFPDAKVLLSVRSPESWYTSTYETIYSAGKIPEWMMALAPMLSKPAKVVNQAIWDGYFESRFEDKAFAIQKFNQWIEDVKRTVPADKLLIFDAKQGWEPLCKFLDVPIPDTPFPHVNDRATMKRMLRILKTLAYTVPLLFIVSLVYWILNYFI